MASIREKILKKFKKDNELMQLVETVTYGQQLGRIGFWAYNLQEDRVILSDEIYNILGSNPEKFDKIIENYNSYIHPDDVKKVEKAFREVLEGKEYDIEYRIINSDGEKKYVNGKTKVFRDEDNNLIKIIGIIQDITNQKLVENNLKAIEKDLNLAQMVSGVGSWKYDVIKDEFYGTEQMYRIYDINSEDHKNDFINTIELIHPDDRAKVQDAMKKHLQGKTCELEFRIPCKDGSVKYVIGRGEPLFDGGGQIIGVLGTVQDITDRIEMKKYITYTANHDELTGLPNRTYFKEHLKDVHQYAKEKHTSFAVIMVNIGEFKHVNDVLGYELGDELINLISYRLKNFIGDDGFICRYFGNQFGIIISGYSNIKEYEDIAIKIIRLFDKPFMLDKYELIMPSNVGASIYPEDGVDVEDIIKHANVALMRAKQEGKNIYKFYSSQMDVQSYKQFMLRNDLHKAIWKNQFMIYYQPLVKLKDNRLLGAEALIRWEHPDWGIVSPDEFIPLLEETGLIIDIGKWTLKEVCRNYKKWLNEGMPEIKISVNFSTMQFLENNFVDNIKNIIDEFGLDPHFLIMEITESTFIREIDRVNSDIKRLQSFGIQVALDDFGTGYSSLGYLNSLNIDILKIDGSFIKSIITDDTSAIITKSIINLARELKIKLIAEGIENWQQLSKLRELSCHTGQGYIYSRAVPLVEFEKVLVKGKCGPNIDENAKREVYEGRRKFFRINFNNLLESDFTINTIKGKKMNVGNTKILIKDIGPGGICFISNLSLPVKKDIVLKFTMRLIEEINLSGYIVWSEEIEENLYQYGVEFIIDENERVNLIRILNQVQIKIKKNTLIAEGDFISGSPRKYFKK